MPFKPTDYLPYDFANRRHIGPSPAEMDGMLEVLGVKDLDQLIDQTVPKAIRQKAPLDIGRAMSERELLHHMRVTAGKNRVLKSLIGQGYYGTVTPPAIQRNILENPAWYTAYTPYQPEISQGRLEALLNFQTMVSDLTGLEIANASLLDEATACAEAMTMAQRVAKSKAKAFFVDRDCHPQNIAVIQTRAAPLGIEVIVGNPDKMDPEAVFGAVFQYPGTYGHVRDFTPHIEKLHEHKAIAIVSADILALTLLKEPGAMGPILPSAIPSGSVCRWALADRTRLIWLVLRRISGRCPGGLSEFPSTAMATAPTGWRCRPGNSISGARRRHQTCVPRRRFWR